MTAILALACLAPASTQTPLDVLERDLAGKMSPFLGSQHGSFYIGGQSLAANNPLTTLWNVRENETIGFTHPWFRDGRARGEAIACDAITGCGHSLTGWEFYRNTRVLYGNVSIVDTYTGATVRVESGAYTVASPHAHALRHSHTRPPSICTHVYRHNTSIRRQRRCSGARIG
jgi:hypothetical protein